MDSRLFGDLVQSLKEAGQIARGEIASPRRTVVNSLDVKTVRETENWDDLSCIEDVMDQPSFVHLRTQIWKLLREQQGAELH